MSDQPKPAPTRIKLTDIRPCDVCAGPLGIVFYRFTFSFRQLGLNPRGYQQAAGLAMQLGSAELARVMGTDPDVAIEMPGYQVDRDMFICQDCILNRLYALRLVDLMEDE